MRFCFSLAALALLASQGFAQITSAQVTTERAAARLLDQATWGPIPSSEAQLEATTISDWLNAQFALNTSDLPDQPILDSAGKSNNNLAPVQAAFFQNAVTGPGPAAAARGLRSEPDLGGFADDPEFRPAYAYPPYWRIFRDNAFGNYRDVIKAVTLSPAMGRYLNMANNNKANAAKGTAAERELRPRTDAAVHARPDPVESGWHARCSMRTTIRSPLTIRRWSPTWRRSSPAGLIPPRPAPPRKPTIRPITSGQMFAVEAEHDTTAKTIFGNITIPAGQTAEQDLDCASRRADGAADHGAVRQPAIDPAPGDQQSRARLISQRVSHGFRE